MSSIFSSIIATFVTMPFLGYVVVFIISKQLTGNHRRSVLLAIDVSTFLLIISVHYLTVAIWKKSFLGIIFITILITAIIFVFFHWKTKEDIIFPQVFRGVWRINFLLFFSAYIVLFLYGLIQKVASSLSMP
ncbi:DUF3397 domain-containing protein [Bacillus methanolicus]|uniref:DUF3397 domain-containing protein n=1 Tax=Bacillus methanolicus (strain MGA3 / ATCC 53907) TaxID=796606 RepID=I3DZ05_BACMM|nr:DUF3397 domain-containing protein [Bacillus methanolicus]AIE59550.1 hypothetical protein BMMGA3_05610 [Bacillus methanolicus MGA3]EIJ79476.1 hypothetical protein MGA3_14011 [Bacillus methanolicus MGA3]